MKPYGKRKSEEFLAKRIVAKRQELFWQEEFQRPRSAGVSNPYSLRAVAEALGVSQELVYRWEHCKKCPPSQEMWENWGTSVGMEIKFELETW